jgi:hypothetical protein
VNSFIFIHCQNGSLPLGWVCGQGAVAGPSEHPGQQPHQAPVCRRHRATGDHSMTRTAFENSLIGLLIVLSIFAGPSLMLA